ncbi:unnamed protein product [Caenorhabditis brenneri]
MSEVFETNEMAYRACILYEALHGKSVEETYDNMKKVKTNVVYSDLQYWFNRFLGGNHDLTRGFLDMPMEVVDNIVGYLDLVDKLATRKVCRKLRAVIDNQESKFGEVGVYIDDEFCFVDIEDLKISYGPNEAFKTIESSKAALTDFASVINQQKWKFIDIRISLTQGYSHLGSDLNALLSNHKIHVQCLTIRGNTMEPLATLLPRFETGCLVFYWEYFSNDDGESWFKVIEMDHWKKLTAFEIGSPPDGFPIDAFFHARVCNIHNLRLTEDRIGKIRDFLFTAPDFEYFGFFDLYKREEELKVLVDRVMGTHSAYNPQTQVYRIENSKDYFQLSIFDSTGFSHLIITRIRS